MRLLIFLFLFPGILFSQSQFKLAHPATQTEIPFELVNNLIILKAKINGVQLNLIFDTGVKQTILINLKSLDSVKLQGLSHKKFTGIGKENTSIDGLSSTNNRFNLEDKIMNSKALIYIITGAEFHFSETIGININGLIGGELIRNFLVKIDYKRKKMIFYKPETFNYKKLKRYHKYKIQIIDGKPYLNARVKVLKHSRTQPLKLLLDSGNSDALWIFDHKKIKLPNTQKTIEDYFGLGFSGDITGVRAKIFKFSLDDKYRFKSVYIGLPDPIFFSHIVAQNPFDGLVGNEILKRFFVWLDYKNGYLYLKKYHKNYRQPFLFNDTGIYLAYQGKIPVLVKQLTTQFDNRLEGEAINVFKEETYVYKYELVNRIVINYIRKNSPADKAGLIPGDVLLKINDKDVYQYRLDKLEEKFFYHNKTYLNLLIQRKGLTLSFKVYNTNQL